MRRTGRYATAAARSLGIEALSTLREVVLSPFDIAPVLPDVKRGDDLVVLVHGFFASAGVFRPMRQKLEAETGARVATFTHVPGVGVRRIALSLARIVDRIPAGVKIHLVGHSLGGLVARWYVQELGGHAHVTQTISLAAPFGGAPAAHAFPFLVGADLRRSSKVLERLRSDARTDVPHTSIMGTADRVVFPLDSAAFHHGERFVMHGRGHNSLLFDPEVHRIIAARIRGHELGRTA
jgi:pimeloyl-ACP methyl ester carboxylesterase